MTSTLVVHSVMARSSSSWCAYRPAVGREAAVLQEILPSDPVGEGGPLVVVAHADRQPALLAPARVDALWRPFGIPVPGALRLAPELHLDERVAELVEHVLDLGELDELSAADRGAVVQRGKHRERAGRPGRGVHVHRGRGLDHLEVVVADELREPAEAVELRAEPRVVRPVAVEAGRGDAQHEHLGVAVEQLGLVDADLVQRRCLEVLDEDVGLLDQAHQELAARPDGAGRACTRACSGRSSCSSHDGCTADPQHRPPAARTSRGGCRAASSGSAAGGSPWWWAGTPTGSPPGSPRRRDRRAAGSRRDRTTPW